MSNRHSAVIMSILILFSLGFSMSNAKAETIHMYVQKMPQHWQDQFGDVLSKATQYWEEKIPNLKFETAQHVYKSDFVVEWASQYGEGKLGYYSTNVDNAYGKPTMAITLGFFKDKEWHLVSSEQVLEITKHELGHAIGMPYSDDPNNIMYPTIEDYESWQQDSVQTIQVSTSTDWQTKSEKYQKLATDKISPFASKISEAQLLLNSVSSDSEAGKDALDDAWLAFWWAKKYLYSAEKLQVDGGTSVLQSNYYESYIKFKSSYDYANKVEQKLEQITKHIERADNLA